ncbi:MAG: lysophospholipid acyltransferase family protein [Dehalococcoidia bacterium]
MWRSLAIRAVVRLIEAVPLRISYFVAWYAGIAVFALWPGGRKRTIENMLHVAGGDRGSAARYARRSFSYYALYLIDFLRMGRVGPGELERRLEFEDWERFDEARAGAGMLFVTLHFGNWDFAAARIASHGLPLAVITDTFEDRSVDRIVVETRERLGVRIIPAERTGPGVLRALHRNEVVALLIDIPDIASSVEVEFFGGTVAVPDGPARIALRTGASVIVGAVARDGVRSERFVPFIERVEYTPTGEREDDVRGFTQAMLSALERMVRRYPEQWYIFRLLWVADRERAEAG